MASKHCHGVRIIFYQPILSDKFQSLIINPQKLDKDKSDKTLSINDLDSANTELIKLLGLHIDENLNFTEHISKLCIKPSQKVGELSVTPLKPNTLQG